MVQYYSTPQRLFGASRIQACDQYDLGVSPWSLECLVSWCGHGLGLHGSVLIEKPETFVGLEESSKQLKSEKKIVYKMIVRV